MTSAAATAILRGLRRPNDEPQLTRALASVFQADPGMGSQFVNLVLQNVGKGAVPAAPPDLHCTTEELVEDGRLDLRFRADQWDVIVELKIYASYGRDQMGRYLRSLHSVDNPYLAAVTRTVPAYGEPPAGTDARWLGSVRWRRLLPELRAMRSEDPALTSQWPLFIDVLEAEGSMGFTQPKPELFGVFEQLRAARKHTDEFVGALQMPLLEALVDALGGDPNAASVYLTKGGRMHIARSWNAITDTIFLVPAKGQQRIRAGVFAYNPPARFFVAPKNGRTWIARLSKLSSEAKQAVEFLISRGFRDSDLHVFLLLDEQRLLSPTLEEEVVEWAHDRFVDIVESGLLACIVDSPPGEPGDDPGDDEDPSA
jgi:hypothetical protein